VASITCQSLSDVAQLTLTTSGIRKGKQSAENHQGQVAVKLWATDVPAEAHSHAPMDPTNSSSGNSDAIWYHANPESNIANPMDVHAGTKTRAPAAADDLLISAAAVETAAAPARPVEDANVAELKLTTDELLPDSPAVVAATASDIDLAVLNSLETLHQAATVEPAGTDPPPSPLAPTDLPPLPPPNPSEGPLIAAEYSRYLERHAAGETFLQRCGLLAGRDCGSAAVGCAVWPSQANRPG